MQSFDKLNRKWDVLSLLRLEVNPAKHHDKKIFLDVLEWIRQNCTSGTLKKYDYVIDENGFIQIDDDVELPFD